MLVMLVVVMLQTVQLACAQLPTYKRSILRQVWCRVG